MAGNALNFWSLVAENSKATRFLRLLISEPVAGCCNPGVPAGFGGFRSQAQGILLLRRVQDIDFARNEILIRDGKGAKDRISMLPESLKTPVQEHLKELLDHSDVKTTMIYTHVLNRGPSGVRSPIDTL